MCTQYELKFQTIQLFRTTNLLQFLQAFAVSAGQDRENQIYPIVVDKVVTVFWPWSGKLKDESRKLKGSWHGGSVEFAVASFPVCRQAGSQRRTENNHGNLYYLSATQMN